MMQVAIESLDLAEAPRRLVLGSNAYNGIHDVLTKRLAAPKAGRPLRFPRALRRGPHKRRLRELRAHCYRVEPADCKLPLPQVLGNHIIRKVSYAQTELGEDLGADDASPDSSGTDRVKEFHPKRPD